MLPPPNPQAAALFRQAEMLERQGRFDAAAGVYENLVRQDKRNVRALTLLGLALMQLQRHEEAVTAFEKAVAAAPGAADPLVNLAMVHMRLSRPDKAEPLALAALRIDDHSTAALQTLFKCYQQLNKPARALQYIRRALELAPDNAEFRVDLAQCLDYSGEPAEACTHFRALLQDNRYFIHAYDGLARATTWQEEPDFFPGLQQRLAQGGLSERDAAWLHRAAAKIHDDLGHTDQAFAHFLAAKNPEAARTRVAAFERYVAAAQQVFDADFFRRRKQAGLPSERPVFVFGMPRSGTTLVEQILSSHPDVHGADELRYFLACADRLTGADAAAGLGAAAARLGTGTIQGIARDYLKLLLAHSADARRVVDKMPLNAEVLWLLALAFPRARFIHCVRDPLATCTSCFIQPLGHRHAYADDLASLGRYYRLHETLMAHWKAVLPVEILEFRYEDLVTDQEGQTRRLLDHIGLSWDARCLDFHRTRRNVRTPSRRQVERPLYRSALDGWRRYDAHLGPLRAALDAPP